MAGFTLIKIFADTNILHASQAHLLLSSTVAQYIAEHKKIESVDLKWMLPQMVLDERRHQMIQAAKGLMPKITELEKLLGHQLGINEEILGERIDSKIKKSVDDLAIEVCEIDYDAVDWRELVSRSANRQVPFEISGEKEKGFRDAIIAHTFLQEHAKSPTTPRSCLLVFISGDKIMRDYLSQKTEGAKNVRILETLDDLKSLLNAIASEITEEFLQEFTPKAKKVFYDFDEKDGLYNKDKIYEETEKHSAELKSVCENFPASVRKEDGVTLDETTFIKKEGQTVVWRTKISRKFKVIKAPNLGDIAAMLAAQNTLQTGSSQVQEVVLASGSSVFSIEWQHQITTTGKISRPKVLRVEFEGHEWNNSAGG